MSEYNLNLVLNLKYILRQKRVEVTGTMAYLQLHQVLPLSFAVVDYKKSQL